MRLWFKSIWASLCSSFFGAEKRYQKKLEQDTKAIKERSQWVFLMRLTKAL
jgi:hypothetical protein